MIEVHQYSVDRELGDMFVCIGGEYVLYADHVAVLATTRRAALEECFAVDPYNIECPTCGRGVQVACLDGCPRFPRFRAAIRALDEPADAGRES